jgi:hypothetical protein
LRAQVFLTDEALHHERNVFNTVDLLGELGGIIEIFIIIFGIIIFPFSKQSFVQTAIRLLFKARTNDQYLFKKSENSKRSLRHYLNLNASVKSRE